MLMCQRIGCDANFIDTKNPEGGCRYHPGPPLFHDGTKEWGCCKKKSYDFGDFMSLPGCVTGKHTSEKPAPVAATQAAAPPSPPVASAIPASKSKCARCSQGFFCADHAPLPAQSSTPATCQSHGPPLAVSAKLPASVGAAAPTAAPPDQPKLKDVRAKQVCARKGCGASFSEMMNSATACKYHPGPPVFHDRSKGLDMALVVQQWSEEVYNLLEALMACR